ncbi:hypothetical protein [Lysobacter auxotrophicus]|uniref:Positive regulator of sigma(E), RseC/MucC n=1 Tax=Lysobacter auxotrophicus TaxID=2992573 RepID=A0ABM8DII9_9GAMM|nr:hypothetical protein [Lysobacter auxotrophicus]BDU18468.1 hypothetical protein LA521A_36690 [Lysobacter auxotrophicus]
MSRLSEALSAEVGGDCWRDGKDLVVRPGCTLPGRCIKCNEPAELPMRHARFYWHHPALYLVVFLGLLLYLVIAVFVRRRTPVTLGLCARHRQRRRASLAIAFGGALLGVLAIGVGAARELVPLSLAGLGVIVASVIVGILGSRLLVVTRIGENYTRFRGAGDEFLSTLPAFYRAR